MGDIRALLLRQIRSATTKYFPNLLFLDSLIANIGNTRFTKRKRISDRATGLPEERSPEGTQMQ